MVCVCGLALVAVSVVVPGILNSNVRRSEWPSEPMPERESWAVWHQRVGFREGDQLLTGSRSWSWGFERRSVFVQRADDIILCAETRTGWPALCALGTSRVDFLLSGARITRSNLLVVPDVGFVPYTVIWHGLLINFVSYSVGVALLVWFAQGTRRRFRRLRGLCPECAYVVRDQYRCPECGAATTKKNEKK